jgi:S1-C subfamily serine protease/tRNA A-37 threonylcarbamoyl transferase component Bud32
MPVIWSCPQHHRWQPRATDSATLDAVQTCPVCGQPGSFVDADTDDTPGGATVTAGDGSRPVPASAVRVPGYAVTQEIGRGAMGVVYKAREEALNRPVALKMILAGSHAGARDVARFRREVETVAGLRHPNIVSIYAVGEAGGLPYCALEYVEDGNLAQKLRGRPMEGRSAARLVALLARSVHYAHQRGVVHRDLKPSNVLLTEDGQPKIADFGLAKLHGGEASLTGSSAVLGTPAYMAPEQAGDGKKVGPAADVYALGAILYELLTGRPPFKAGSALETLQLVQQADPLPPRRARPRVPRDLETVCLKCLEKDPAKRYNSAQALADDLERFVAGEPVQARPRGLLGRAARWAGRHVAALAGAGAVAAAALLLAGLWPREPSPAGPGQPPPAEPMDATQLLRLFADQISRLGPDAPPAADAELLVHVTRGVEAGDEHTGPGSLYFEKGVVLTSSELLGMSAKDSPPPLKVEVVYHPGRPDARTYPAEVVSVEPVVKVAVLKLQGQDLPEPPPPPAALAQAEPTGPVEPRPKRPPTPPPVRQQTRGGPLPPRPEVLERARQAAVLVRVSRGGQHWMGSGFFAGERGVVVTAAHVLGLRERAQPAPDRVEVVVGPAAPGERTLPARLLAVDPEGDLAVLRVEADMGLPEPLARLPRDEPVEGHWLYTLGFPGEAGLLKRSEGAGAPAPALKVRPAALVRRGSPRPGAAPLLQLEGGADPGNAGCAVIDAEGRCVGVLVTEMPGMRIQFATPAANVARLLEGRLLTLRAGPAHATPKGDALPVVARLADPLDRVRKLALLVWSGQRGPTRPGTDTVTPVPERGDGPVGTFVLQPAGAAPPGEGRPLEGELLLPPLAEGRELWVRPRYTDADGAERWGEAMSIGRPTARVERLPTTLRDRPAGAARVILQTHYQERSANRFYSPPASTVELTESSRPPADGRGGRAARVLAALEVPLPDREDAPGETWDGTVSAWSEGSTTKGEAEVKLAMHYRYLGRSSHAGGTAALVELTGRPAPGQDAAGEAHGYALIDPATGRVTLARAHFDVSAPVRFGGAAPVRVHFTLHAALARAPGADGPALELDLSALPLDQPISLPVAGR